MKIKLLNSVGYRGLDMCVGKILNIENSLSNGVEILGQELIDNGAIEKCFEKDYQYYFPSYAYLEVKTENMYVVSFENGEKIKVSDEIAKTLINSVKNSDGKKYEKMFFYNNEQLLLIDINQIVAIYKPL